MKVNALLSLFFVAVCSLFASTTVQAQSYTNDDLYNLGMAWFYGDDTYLNDIVEDDLYFFGMSMINEDEDVINDVYSDDLYYAGMALLNLEDSMYAEDLIYNIESDDWYFFVAAFLDNSTGVMDLVEDDRVYYMGMALLENDEDYLEYILDSDVPMAGGSEFDPYDLYYLGMAYLNDDESEADMILDDDLYYLAMGILNGDENTLDNIVDDDIYYVGQGMINLGDFDLVEDYLSNIVDDDWYYFLAGFQDESESVFDLIVSDPLYYLGIAMFNRDYDYLEYVIDYGYDDDWDDDWYDEPSVYHDYSNSDCYNLGMYMLTKDDSYQQRISDADLAALGSAYVSGKTLALSDVEDDDVYFAALSLFFAKSHPDRTDELKFNIYSDDWYYLISAVGSKMASDDEEDDDYDDYDYYEYDIDYIHHSGLQALARALYYNDANELEILMVFNGNDLYNLGQYLITEDKKYSGKITNKQLANFGLAITGKNMELMNTIATDDLYFLGMFMLNKESHPERADEFMFDIMNDDLYYLAQGIMYGDTYELDSIVDDNLYYFGMAIVNNDVSSLENIVKD